MKYHTDNELENFRFKGAFLAQTCAVSSIFELILDNVIILPENSCNRDIREMRTNALKLKIVEPEQVELIEEGYKIYDANGNLREAKEDAMVPAEAVSAALKELEGCEIYSIEKEDNRYRISIDTEDHTFLLKVNGSGDVEEWDRFLSKDEGV